jgi:hypothetical protein
MKITSCYRYRSLSGAINLGATLLLGVVVAFWAHSFWLGVIAFLAVGCLLPHPNHFTTDCDCALPEEAPELPAGMSPMIFSRREAYRLSQDFNIPGRARTLAAYLVQTMDEVKKADTTENKAKLETDRLNLHRELSWHRRTV